MLGPTLHAKGHELWSVNFEKPDIFNRCIEFALTGNKIIIWKLHVDLFSAPARRTSLEVGWITPNALNVTCKATEVYPEPIIKMMIDGSLFNNQR